LWPSAEHEPSNDRLIDGARKTDSALAELPKKDGKNKNPRP